MIVRTLFVLAVLVGCRGEPRPKECDVLCREVFGLESLAPVGARCRCTAPTPGGD